MNETNSIWVHVLQVKYKVMGELMLTLTAKRKVSHIWRGLCFVWPKFRKGVKRVIFYGLLITFWSEEWIGKIFI